MNNVWMSHIYLKTTEEHHGRRTAHQVWAIVNGVPVKMPMQLCSTYVATDVNTSG